MHSHTAVGTALTLSLTAIVTDTAGQAVPLEQANVAVLVDTGLVANTAAKVGTIFRTVVKVPEASWIRLTFEEARLADGTVLRMTSLADGAIQHHTATTLEQWNDTSAYFNGNAVRIELIAQPGDEQSRILITNVLIGPPPDGAMASQCGPTDDRLPSSDPRVARSSPVGCTAWLISDASNCFITAGHCYSVASMQICEFNVPLSNSNGSWNHPPPSEQYTVDHSSAQWVNGGIGNDWCYFGCFTNTETGLSAFQAQGDAFDLASSPPNAPPRETIAAQLLAVTLQPFDALARQTIRITGHGTDSSPLIWNQVQQTHTGPYTAFFGTTVQYQVDTTGGSSGSPVINESTGKAIGVHTHAGCTSGGGANQGTGVNLFSWQSALANPEGICIPMPGIEFDFPNGLPEFLNPDGDSILVSVTGANGGELEPGSATLHYAVTGDFQSVPMAPIGGDLFDAVFPAVGCGEVVRFYFSAKTTLGVLVLNPLFAPNEFYTAIGGISQESIFTDDFERDFGWSVTVDDDLTDGQWERAVPIANSVCDRGNPGSDADGSGMCYVTDNDLATCNSDVDNGATILTSPILDASVGTSFINYWRWYDNTGSGNGTNPGEDVMVIEITDDAGANWVELETVGPTGPEAEGGWFFRSHRVEDFVDSTSQLQIRFIVSDLNLASIIEAGVDGVELVQIGCPNNPIGDIDGDGIVGVNDMLLLLADWGPCEDPCPPTCVADLTDDCIVGVNDFLLLLANWTL